MNLDREINILFLTLKERASPIDISLEISQQISTDDLNFFSKYTDIAHSQFDSKRLIGNLRIHEVTLFPVIFAKISSIFACVLLGEKKRSQMVKTRCKE